MTRARRGGVNTLFRQSLGTTAGVAAFNSLMLSFDGVNERLHVGPLNTTNGLVRCTWSMWIQNTSGSWGTNAIFERSTPQDVFGIRSQAGGNLRVIIQSGSTAARIDTNTGNWATNTPYHVVVTWDGDDGGTDGKSRVRIYRDAVSQSCGAVANPPFPLMLNTSTTITGTIGGTLAPQPQFAGDVDEVAIWTGLAVSQSQVTELFNGGHPGDLSTFSLGAPTHWWRMGDGATFPTVPDVGSNGLASGTMTNMEAEDITSTVF